MTLAHLHGARVGVWGAGAEGRSALRHLAGAAETTLLLDDVTTIDVAAFVDEYHCDVVTTEEAIARPFDIVIRSAGVPTRRGEVQEFIARGVPVRGLLAIWLAEHREAATIAITGTKGKSTTASLCGRLLEASGVAAAVGGNIGIPIIDLPDDAEVYVIEVSSYQAADVADSPRVGVLTSLGIDHLPWHGGVEQYWDDKLNLFAHAGLQRFVAPAELLDGHPGVASSPARARAVDDDVRVTPAGLVVADRPVRPLHGPLAARHNAENLATAVRAVRALGVDVADDQLDAVIAEYGGLPSRLEELGEVRGVTFVDDALASNPLACEAGVETMGDRALVLLAGGADRGVAIDALARRLAASPGLRAVVLFSETADAWHRHLVAAGVGVDRVVVVTSDHVTDAFHAARRFIEPGATVLFSPAAPTPAALGTYLDRSAAFARAVDEFAATP